MTSAVQKDVLPTFDTTAYCKTVAATVDGSYQIEEKCQKEELKAFAQLRQIAAQIPSTRYCREIGDAIGGSYQTMLSCVQEEIEAAGRS